MSAVDVHPLIVETAAWRSEDDTRATAESLAACPGLRNAFIALQGDLGAGKTTFVRHLLRALGVQGRIKSPTYAVVEPHEVTLDAEPLAIWHFDFYRFNDPREWEDAGLRDIFAQQGLKLAEWPGQAAGFLPREDLTLRIDMQTDETRLITCSAFTPTGQALVQALKPTGAASA